ncbi:hypothetical protein H4W34_002173 [Actinomadura algeriensis]|uniref:Uncharacterized protein n=1 Tax=Actinomadura algeriensis TaxID=1679523 RepID=A0ABR9JP47_9ACTN|nr:hypothetical protein [Actinomadura algeriensis]
MRAESAAEVAGGDEPDPGGDGLHRKVGLFEQFPGRVEAAAEQPLPGLVPSCSVNRRVRVRLESPARSASRSRVNRPSSRETAHSSSGASDSSALAGTGRAAYWSWLPSRCGGSTMFRAIRAAWAAPWSVRTRCRHRSMPAPVPALVATSPWSTYRTSGSTCTSGKAAAS